MKKRVKYYHINVHLNRVMNQEIETESYRLSISKQDFIRSLISDYFLRIHGRDIILESHKLKYHEQDSRQNDERN